MNYSDRRFVGIITGKMKPADVTFYECLFDEMSDGDEAMLQEAVEHIKREKRLIALQLLGAPLFLIFSIGGSAVAGGYQYCKAQYASLRYLFTPVKELVKRLQLL